MNHSFNRTILIVCEGEGTEPSYFNSIRDLIVGKDPKIKIRISPMPKEEQAIVFTLRNGAKKRELRKIDALKEASIRQYEIEDSHKAQPVRYVREAQIGLEDGAFDEVWAVFDKDGHPKQKEAFELAGKVINGKKTNIGFSSISFEYWLLLHFEKKDTVFLKSRCRENRVFYDCGCGINSDDCRGLRCVCGYLTEKKYLAKNWNEKTVSFSELPNVIVAINNSVWLRRLKISQNSKIPVFEHNPYINLDKLIFNLLQLPKTFTWFERDELVLMENISFKMEKVEDMIHIVIENIKEVKFILLKGVFNLVDASGDFLPFGDRIILDENGHTNIDFDLKTTNGFDSIYLAFMISTDQFLICDL